jgi:hypothetical protein
VVTGFIGNHSLALDMAMLPESGPTTGLGFLSIHRKGLIIAPARMTDVIGATPKRYPFQRVIHIKDQGRLHSNGGM